ncbi:MAG TPA: hypothetical protein VGC91_17255 [Pyrinomonadaceae bacterium]
MTADEIKQYLEELNDELRAIDVKGEVCLYGGAVMCIAFNARPATKDVDAVFEPVRQIRKAAGIIADRHGLNKDWLNYAVKMFLVPHDKRILLDLSHLKVFVPESDYLLAMKVIAARTDTSDLEDIQFLIVQLKLQSPVQVLEIIEQYYPHRQIKPETKFQLEALFDQNK